MNIGNVRHNARLCGPTHAFTLSESVDCSRKWAMPAFGDNPTQASKPSVCKAHSG